MTDVDFGKLQAGDEEAWSAYAIHIRPRLCRFARCQFQCDWEEAIELAQESLVRAWMNRQKLTSDGYLFSILRNMQVDASRKRKRQKTDSLAETPDVARPDEDSTARALLVDCLPSLDPDARELFALKMEGYSAKEIGTRLGVLPNAIDNRWHRVVQRLKECFGKRG